MTDIWADPDQLTDADMAPLAAEELLKLQVDGFDTSDPHFVGTPERFSRMLRELTTPEPFNFTTFETQLDEMVVSSNIPFYTFCAHHILPFFGVCHIGYIPNGKIAGISKLARAMEFYCRGLNVQEELTRRIADRLEEELEPIGVAVVMRAEHLCQTMRGIQKPGAITTTSAMLGAFADHSKMARSEFLSLIKD